MRINMCLGHPQNCWSCREWSICGDLLGRHLPRTHGHSEMFYPKIFAILMLKIIIYTTARLSGLMTLSRVPELPSCRTTFSPSYWDAGRMRTKALKFWILIEENNEINLQFRFARLFHLLILQLEKWRMKIDYRKVVE